MKTTKKPTKIILAAVILTVLFASTTFTACNNGPYFSDYAANWVYEDETVSLSLTTTGNHFDKVFGTLTLDGQRYQIVLEISYGAKKLIICDTAKQSTEEVDQYGNTDGRMYAVKFSGYKEYVEFEIMFDYSIRSENFVVEDFAESKLLGKKLKLEKKNLY